ncbi:hypothetical protein GGI03_005514 [Coemansia sp. RSA 2337]|nr:hypothetical protein GGI14_004829 [Coemansia sp. S680]KAJ2031279.1 hypothetical protein H4S03_006699 [Coemansia sp. S3946]KAJ2044506.1 hypothetical protein H4S04_006175 [Coemansia sp. S16]KAJ2051943.1 hypothetical protein GGI08_005139 [Coemansia sp. S2]KAJ2337515.1 hypothetical protein GGH92_007511 [Coemansia sp. RSA 2673]KAJ2459563.1 hypothetical protein GGI03_005514 [Coemansia sp. RSA 2337]
MGNPISHPVRIAGRCTHLFNVTYRGKSAILKLSRIRMNRLPEDAVYKVLYNLRARSEDRSEQVDGNMHGMPNLPEIYLSGVIIKNFDGYRLEFLVMEYCGASIVNHIRSLLSDTTTTSDAAPEAAHYICQVVSTLSAALAANVLHRDVSGGNAYIIDWAFDRDKVVKTEGLRNPFTGTFMHMSARLLLVAKESSILELPSLVA